MKSAQATAVAPKTGSELLFGERLLSKGLLTRAQLVEALNAGAEGKIIDVYDEEDGEHVEIFIE